MWVSGYFVLQRCILCTQLNAPGWASARMPVWKNIFGARELNYSSSDWVSSNWLRVSAGETGTVVISFGRVCAETDTSHRLPNSGTKSYRWRRNWGWAPMSWGLWENLWAVMALFSVRGSFSQVLSLCNVVCSVTLMTWHISSFNGCKMELWYHWQQGLYFRFLSEFCFILSSTCQEPGLSIQEGDWWGLEQERNLCLFWVSAISNFISKYTRLLMLESSVTCILSGCNEIEENDVINLCMFVLFFWLCNCKIYVSYHQQWRH